MPYRVEITPSAESEIEAVYRRIQHDSPLNADRWRLQLADRLNHLQLFPEGCGLAPENSRVDFEVRQAFHGVYRILFTVVDDRVVVLHFRHGAQRGLTGKRIASPEQ